jgi:sphingomyelin phosphodiesterase
MFVAKQAALVLASLAASSVVHAQNNTFGPSAFTAPGAFPTSVYSRYYNNPTATSAQVQPVISDPVREARSLTGLKFAFIITHSQPI